METDLTEEQRQYADVAQTSGRTLLALIDDILDLSKIEARKITLENLNFNPRDAIEDVVQLLRVQANAKGLDFGSRVSPEIPPLLSRRCPPPAPGVDQSHRQCHQVHRAGRGHGWMRAVRAPGRRCGNGSFRRRRYGHRDHGRTRLPAILAIRPGGRIHHAQVWRHRARAGHLEAACRDDGGHNPRRKPGRLWFHLLVHRAL